MELQRHHKAFCLCIIGIIMTDHGLGMYTGCLTWTYRVLQSWHVSTLHMQQWCLRVCLLLQVYKETCKEIYYDSDADTIYANCDDSQDGSADAFVSASFPDASNCYQSIANNLGTLECQAGS